MKLLLEIRYTPGVSIVSRSTEEPNAPLSLNHVLLIPITPATAMKCLNNM